MILAVDVGNTHTVAGLYDTQDLAYHWRFVTEAERTADEYGVLLQSLFAARGLSLSCVDRHYCVECCAGHGKNARRSCPDVFSADSSHRQPWYKDRDADPVR